MTMDEKELNEAICNIMFWYKDTPMAIPQKIVELIIKDRKRICEPLVKWKLGEYGREAYEASCIAIDQTLTLAGLDEGEREK